jgi:hypothetical protein
VRNFVETVRREEERLKKELELAQTRQRASLKIQVPGSQSTLRTVHREVVPWLSRSRYKRHGVDTEQSAGK